MKKFIISIALLAAGTVFAADGQTISVTPGTAATVSAPVAATVANSGSVAGASNQIGCLVNCASTDQGSKDLADSTVQAALINAQTARDVASTTQTIKNTPSVSGPNLTTSNDTCMGSTSGSLNIAGLGFGGGTSWVDDNCKMLKNSRELWNMGMKAASLALMCTDKANKEALEITGFICPQTAAARKAEDDAKATELKLKSTDTLSLAK